jgi:putative component of toxin-antitoxin plasmid stabilization module
MSHRSERRSPASLAANICRFDATSGQGSIAVLLAGGDKSTQARDIKLAIALAKQV